MKVILIFLAFCVEAFNFKLSNQRDFLNSNIRIPEGHDKPIEVNISESYARFFAFGDWGGIPIFPYRTLVQNNVAKFMHKTSNKMKVHFQLGLGDNFYFDGVTSVNDTRFKNTFEDVFLDMEIPWFMVLGNHDYLGDPIAQIEYTKHSKRWIMPNQNYSIRVNTHNGREKLIYFLMIDTVLLCQTTKFEDRSDNGVLKTLNIKRINVKNYFDDIERQLVEISSENYPYVIVAGHYPVWSIAEHGPTKCLVDNLRPLLHKYKVNAYFAGHEHDLEHLSHTDMNSTVEYIVTGITNIPYNSSAHKKDVPQDSLKFYWSDIFQIHGALALVEADLNAMNISFYKTDGKKLYQITIKNKYLK